MSLRSVRLIKMEHFPSDYTDYFLIFKRNLQISLPWRGCVGQHLSQKLCFVLLVTTGLIISSFPALMTCDVHSASRSCQQVVYCSGILLPRLPQFRSKDTRNWEDKLPHAMVTRTLCHGCGCVRLRNMRLTAKEFSRAVNCQPSKGFAFHSEFVIKFKFFFLFAPQDTGLLEI